MESKQGYAVISIEDLRELSNAMALVEVIFNDIKKDGFLTNYTIRIKDNELQALFPRKYEKVESEINV